MHNVKAKKQYDPATILSLLDLTLLDSNATDESLAKLKKQAENGVAAICVFPQHLLHFQETANYRRATVVNFPSGQETLVKSLETIKIAQNYGVEEIDYVFPYTEYLKGNPKDALDQAEKVFNYCKENNLLSKVILETGALELSVIYSLSKELIIRGCDFLKTSTGKITQGATPIAVVEMLKAIHEAHSNCGIKISGGIKTINDAATYIFLAELVMDTPLTKNSFRIGASSLINELIIT